MTLLLACLVGVLTGLRSLTPAAVTAWAAYRGWLVLPDPLAWMGTPAAVWIFTVLALLELAADKHPKAPSRTAPPGLITRVVMGALTGACVAAAGGRGLILGAVLGLAGSIVGTFGGYLARTGLVRALRTPDFVVALMEDALTIGWSIWAVSRF